MSRILVIEDDQTVLECMKEFLEEESGHEILTASDSREGLRMIRKSPPDLLILDLRMPQMDGFELLEEARRTHPELKAIALSAFDNEEWQRHAFELGVIYYLKKPLDLDAFKKILSELL